MYLCRKGLAMLDKLAGTALVVLGLVNAVPSLAAVNPVAVTVDYIDDDLTGSGMELRENNVKQAQRRHATRLRLLSDGDRAALLRVIDDVPRVIGDRVPECANDPALAALTIQLIRALYDGSSLTVEALAARNMLPPEVVLGKLERLDASGLVRLSPESNRRDARRVLPTPTLQAYGDDILDRLYYAFAQAVNRR
jgi:DNA-binding transcriptional ArsR family regulator